MCPAKKYEFSGEGRTKAMSIRRGLGYSPINFYCEDMDFHHMHLNGDKNIGIYLPKEVHRSTFHDHITGQGMNEINKKALLWLANQDTISEDVQRKYKLLRDRNFKIKSSISLEVWDRVGKKGTCINTYNDIIISMLDIDDDIDRCIEGEEPQTEKLKKLKIKWLKSLCVSTEDDIPN